MTVVPGELNCVRPDVFHADQFQIGANRFGVEHPFAGPFVAAGCARAFAAEQEIGNRIDVRIGPGHFENLFGLKGTDVGGRIRHLRWLK